MSSRKRPAKPKSKATKAAGVVVAFPGTLPIEKRTTAYLLRCRFRSGAVVVMNVVEADMGRVWSAVQEEDRFHHFVVFDAQDRRIAVNLQHLVTTQFHGDVTEPLHGAYVSGDGVLEVYYADDREPVCFKVPPDTLRIIDIDEGLAEPDERTIQLANLFHYCESSHPETDHSVVIVDLAKSLIWLRLNDVALVSVPLAYVVKNDGNSGR